MELLNIVNPVLSGIITGFILLTVSQKINRNKERERCQALITFLRLEIMNNYRLLSEFEPGANQSPILEDTVWEKVSTEVIARLPFVLTNHLMVHYYFIRHASQSLPFCSAEELDRQKNRMRLIIRRLQKEIEDNTLTKISRRIL